MGDVRISKGSESGRFERGTAESYARAPPSVYRYVTRTFPGVRCFLPREVIWMNEKQLQALAKKNAAKATKADKKPRPTYDPTLEATRGPERTDDNETQRMFKEMKRREF